MISKKKKKWFFVRILSTRRKCCNTPTHFPFLFISQIHTHNSCRTSQRSPSPLSRTMHAKNRWKHVKPTEQIQTQAEKQANTAIFLPAEPTQRPLYSTHHQPTPAKGFLIFNGSQLVGMETSACLGEAPVCNWWDSAPVLSLLLAQETPGTRAEWAMERVRSASSNLEFAGHVAFGSDVNGGKEGCTLTLLCTISLPDSPPKPSPASQLLSHMLPLHVLWGSRTALR